MQAIILAAGRGVRLRPLTDSTHKALIAVAGKPTINHIIDALLLHNVTQIMVVTGYQQAAIIEHLANHYPQIEFQIVHNPEYERTNNIYSLSLAMNALPTQTDDVVLIECDVIFEPSILNYVMQSSHPNIAIVDKYRIGMDGTVVEIRDQIIYDLISKHRQYDGFDFSDKYKTLNIYRLSAEFCHQHLTRFLSFYAQQFDSNIYYEVILGVLIRADRVSIHAAELHGEKWVEIDDAQDLQEGEYLFGTLAARKTLLTTSFGGFWNFPVLDFCYLRNMYFPTPAIIAELKQGLPEIMTNYGSSQRQIDQKMSNYLIAPPECLVTLNGASQIFPVLQQVFKGKSWLIPNRTFGEYHRTISQPITYDDQPGCDPAEIERLAEAAGIVLFVNPNSPTGTSLPTEWILAFAQKYAQKWVVVDESFIDFSDQSGLLSLPAQPLPENILIITSLSKSLGIPGLRLGYAYSTNIGFVETLKTFIPIWNINSIAENFLEIILKHRSDIEQSFVQTRTDRQQFSQGLAVLPQVAQIYPSGGNFLLTRLNFPADDAVRITDHLLDKHNIFVKDVSSRFTQDAVWLRLAVRVPDENQGLVDALKEIH